MMSYLRIRALCKKLWYKLSPTARSLSYLREKLDFNTQAMKKQDIQRQADIDSLVQLMSSLKLKLRGYQMG